MPACKIIDIAQVLSDHYEKKLEYNLIGIRPGEKLHEELVSEYESINTVENNDFRIILPMTRKLNSEYTDYKKMTEEKYTSNDILMNQNEIQDMLKEG
jgi:FlaA1/EpsC-like NDP-sugar epimerase